MKHAGALALDRLEPLLSELRAFKELKEKSRGVFYRRGKAFLHFHEHGSEFYADVRFSDDFERLPATSSTDRNDLVRRVKVCLSDGIGRPIR